jgi:hypothetical protein
MMDRRTFTGGLLGLLAGCGTHAEANKPTDQWQTVDDYLKQQPFTVTVPVARSELCDGHAS